MVPCVRSTCENPIVGRHPAILEVQRLARRVARSRLSVLIAGETGTGKELLARLIHSESPRSGGPFVVVDCGILLRNVAGSELFGHVRGAFTGAVESRCGLIETARGGTLFLDEVGEMSPAMQTYLLRLVQEGEYRPVGDSRMRRADVRVIAATNRDLEKAVSEGRFREDLYHRLNVVQLRLPPLRERRSDIPLLMQHFVARYREEGAGTRPLSPGARALLVDYNWPGNVRELENVVARVSVMGEGDRVSPEELPERLRAEAGAQEEDVYRLPYKEARRRHLDRFVPQYLHRALMRAGGNVSLAARQSGIGRQYFQVRMAEHGLRAKRYRAESGD